MKVSDKAVVMILLVLIGAPFPFCWLVSVWAWWSIACAAVYLLATTAVLVFLAALMIVAHEREQIEAAVDSVEQTIRRIKAEDKQAEHERVKRMASIARSLRQG